MNNKLLPGNSNLTVEKKNFISEKHFKHTFRKNSCCRIDSYIIVHPDTKFEVSAIGKIEEILKNISLMWSMFEIAWN